MEDTSQQVENDFAVSMKFITVKNMWKIIYSKWTLLF
jgi:hypothetical protein